MIYLDFDFSKHPGKHTEYHKVIPLPDHELQCQLLNILFLALGLNLSGRLKRVEASRKGSA
jgi:hypothetical protein